MFSVFGTRESRINDFCEGFNNYWEHRVDTNDLSDGTLERNSKESNTNNFISTLKWDITTTEI
ncbi:MAG: hypothetical protein ACKPKO_64390, partial [Candidatus Fonsibacter sp.]